MLYNGTMKTLNHCLRKTSFPYLIMILFIWSGCEIFAGGKKESSTWGEGIYWATDNETGDFSDWWIDQEDEAVFNNTGPGNEVTITREAAVSGQYALKMEVWDIDRYERACRIFRWSEHLQEGYFSSWLMLPIIPKVNGWNNIFQVKKKDYENNIIDPTFVHQLSYDPTIGGGRLVLDRWGGESAIEPLRDPPVIMANEWFHIEWYYKDGVDNGELKVWVNDELIWNLEDVNTRGVDPDIQWGLALYGHNVDPGHHVMYADDQVISDHRVGSRFFGDSVHKLPFVKIDPYESRIEQVLNRPVEVDNLDEERYASKKIQEVSIEDSTGNTYIDRLTDGNTNDENGYAAETVWPELIFHLSEEVSVDTIGIAWAFIDEQATKFSVYCENEESLNDIQWDPVILNEMSRKNEKGLQLYHLPSPIYTKKIKIVGHYNDTVEWTQWISITEVEFYSPDLREAVRPVKVEGSSAQYPNVPENVLDGNISDTSRWSAETDWNEIIVTLEHNSLINAVALSMPISQKNPLVFDVLISKDSIIWDKIIANRISKSGSNKLFAYGSEVGTREGRYIKIVPKYLLMKENPGEITITEVEVFGPPL